MQFQSTIGRPPQPPLGLLAELTHRCPLGCPYCSNPIALESRGDEIDAATWARVFAEAADLGVLQVHLSGGEPAARRDIIEITAAAHRANLYTNLVTSAVGLTEKTLAAFAEAGLDHVQISIQDSDAASADRIAGYEGAYARKKALAGEVVRLGILLTVNAVIHRANIDGVAAMVDQAVTLGARRVEIAHVQYYGWAIVNRAKLMPTREQVERAAGCVEALRKRYHGSIVIDVALPDYFARYPKLCMGGWGAGRSTSRPPARFCRAMQPRPSPAFWSVRELACRDLAVLTGPSMPSGARDWMKEPCASCPRRFEDFGPWRAAINCPPCYTGREFAEAGGLVSYGPDFADGYRHAGLYAAKILKGMKPADLPVMQSP